MNGSPGSQFVMEKKLRQGCRMLPLLFNFVTEELPILVNQFEERQWLIGTHISGLRERTTVFQYVNDTIMF